MARPSLTGAFFEVPLYARRYHRRSLAFLINWYQDGQRPFVDLLAGKQTSDALIARCQEWLANHYAEAAPVSV